MITEEMKQQLQREIPELLRQDAQFRAWLEELIRQTAVSREHFDACFEKLLRELAEERAERRREADEQNRKWEEQNRRWKEISDERNRKWEEHRREWEEKWEEQNRKWEEQNQRLKEISDEQNRKWEEHRREWEEKWEEQNRKWEEQSRRWKEIWEEQNRRWDEQNHKWEEHHQEWEQKWEEQNRRWKEIWEEQNRQRDEQNRKWDEQNQKWEEQNRKWHEQNRTNQKLLEEITLSRSRYEQGIGALGARWGVASEQSFREALKGILEKSFDVHVLHINEFDDEGLVFGRPDQVEIDLIIKNGMLLLCELKSSMSKSDMYTFQRKVEYYEKRHQRTVQRKIVISPMVHPSARHVAEQFGIEVFTYAEDVNGLSD